MRRIREKQPIFAAFSQICFLGFWWRKEKSKAGFIVYTIFIALWITMTLWTQSVNQMGHVQINYIMTVQFLGHVLQLPHKPNITPVVTLLESTNSSSYVNTAMERYRGCPRSSSKCVLTALAIVLLLDARNIAAGGGTGKNEGIMGEHGLGGTTLLKLYAPAEYLVGRLSWPNTWWEGIKTVVINIVFQLITIFLAMKNMSSSQ
jgi:hypothetical protein